MSSSQQVAVIGTTIDSLDTFAAAVDQWHAAKMEEGNRMLELGLAYNNYPLDNGWLYSTTPQDWRSTDGSVSLRYLRTGDTLFGKRSDTTVAFSDTRLLKGDVTAYNQNIVTGVRGSERQYTVYSGSRDTVLSFANELQIGRASCRERV